MLRHVLILACLIAAGGCQFFPEVSHQPIVHNPFPQLSRVAVAPFFNHSEEPTLDARRFSLAYFRQLQEVPGYEVVPLGTVEEAMLDHRIALNEPGEARRLARVLGVDAVVVGAVTDYSPYYPPRCGFRAEWYSANPGFHEIPPGYGLPWGTPDEEFIPAPLVFEAEMALARKQMETQTPDCDDVVVDLPAPPDGVRQTSAELAQPDPFDMVPGLPPDWPDARGFIPPGPCATRPECNPHDGPVMAHTRIFRGTDPDFTSALASHFNFRDDARFGGWQAYLQRSDDFIDFSCRMHIHEMLAARGGAGETRVVWQWPDDR